MLLPKENTLRSLRELFREHLDSMYGPGEIDAMFRAAVEDKLGVSRSSFVAKGQKLTESQLNLVIPVLELLIEGEPYQYIIGSVRFLGCRLDVDSRVLIPRPETEELCQLVLKENDRKQHLSVLDIGTGSGCIPIALKSNAAAWDMHAIEIDAEAIRLAKHNAIMNKAEVNFISCDILRTTKLERDYSIIISNPPYIANDEKDSIMDNVLVNEPHLALFVDSSDALLFYRRILRLAKHALVPGGRCYFEMNRAYAEDMRSLIGSEGFKNVRIEKDLSGNPRFAICTVG